MCVVSISREDFCMFLQLLFRSVKETTDCGDAIFWKKSEISIGKRIPQTE